MTIFIYIYRGLQYALTSAAAIFAGYLMQADHVVGRDLLIMSIAAVAAWFFFICYANRFDLPTKAEEEQSLRIRRILEKNAVVVFLILVAAWIVIVLLIVSRRNELPANLLVSLSIYVGLLIYYGIFLLRYKTEMLPLIRHWLIWPVVLSIGIGLYYGLSYSLLRESYLPLVPVAIIISFYIASAAFQWDRASFLFRMLLSMFGITAFVVLNLVGIIPLPNTLAAYLSLMFFCIVSCAYLAVFEAWKITANVSAIEERRELAASESDLSGYPVSETSSNLSDRKASHYALATLAALTVTIWVLPFYFVFSDYGTLFLLAFALHALVAFVFWFYRGRPEHLPKSIDWLKVWFGVSFLGILVLSTSAPAKDLIPFRFLDGFADWGGWFFATFLTVFTIPGLIRDASKQQGKTIRSFAIGLLTKRVNVTRLLSLLCVISSFTTIALLRTLEADPAKRYRAELAFYVYVLCIMFCCVIEAIHYVNRRRGMTRLVSTVVGLVLIIRSATSAVISLVIVIPSFHRGVPITSAIVSSLPFFLAACGGFALNDYFDADKDRINKPYRAIPSGRLTPFSVVLIAYFLIGTAAVTAFLVSHSKTELSLYCLSISGVCVYNYSVKHVTLSKNFITAFISTLPLVFVIHALQYPLIYALLPASSVIFLLGREWLMDIRDMKGDYESGIKTLPLRRGPQWTAKISFVAFLASAALLLPIAVRASDLWSTSLLIVLTLSILALSILWFQQNGKHRRAAVLGLWLPIGCGILMLLE